MSLKGRMMLSMRTGARCCKWLCLQYGLAPVTGDGGFRTTGWAEPEDAGAYQNLEYGNITDALHIRHGGVRNWRLGSRFFTAGKSRSRITANVIQHYKSSGQQCTDKLLHSKLNIQKKYYFVHYSLLVGGLRTVPSHA
jgi:hypothetical protein